MSLLKHLLNENTISSNDVLLIVDVQPEYNFDFDMFAFMQYINDEEIEGKDIVYLFNGYDTLGMIKEEDLKHWLYEGSEYDEQMEDLIYNKINFYDKGYAFFRFCMDEGIDDEATVELIKKMIEWDVTDSRDLDRDFWLEFVSENKNNIKNIEAVQELLEHSGDMISVPDLMEELKGLNNITMVGGGINECLREVEIALMVLGKKYNINHEFTF